MHRLFVYGTLRREGDQAQLLEGATFLGRHVTGPHYTLCDLGEYPGAVAWGSTPIIGEVYAVGDALLRQLDEYEECPRLYGRRLIPTPYGEAWMYLLVAPPAMACVIGHGDWCRRDELETGD